MEQEHQHNQEPSPAAPKAVALNPSPAFVGASHSSKIFQPWLSELIKDFFLELSNYIRDFWRVYQLPLLVLSGILAMALALYLIETLLAAINNFPLLNSVLQLIGLGYISWFVYRYLINGSKRQELPSIMQQVKNSLIAVFAQEKETE